MAHTLHERFTFWHMSKDHGAASKSWTDALKNLATVSTIEEFWQIYNHMMRPDEIGPSVGKAPTDIHVFRAGIKPAWEDPANASGGKMMLRLRKPLANQSWERVVLGLVGGTFPAPGTLAAAMVPEGAGALEDAAGAPAGPLLVGLVLSVRAHDDSLALWLRSCHDEAVLGDLRDQLCALLRVPLTVEVDFKAHAKRRKGLARLPARPGQRAALREAAAAHAEAASQAAGAQLASLSASGPGGDVSHGGDTTVGRGSSGSSHPHTARGPGRRQGSGGTGLAAGPRRSDAHGRGASGGDEDDRWAALRGPAPRRAQAHAHAPSTTYGAMSHRGASGDSAISATGRSASGASTSSANAGGGSGMGMGGSGSSNGSGGRGTTTTTTTGGSWRDRAKPFGRGRGVAAGTAGGTGRVEGASSSSNTTLATPAVGGVDVDPGSRLRAARERHSADDEDGVSDYSKSSSYTARPVSGGTRRPPPGTGPPKAVVPKRVSAPDDDGWRTVR